MKNKNNKYFDRHFSRTTNTTNDTEKKARPCDSQSKKSIMCDPLVTATDQRSTA